MDFFQLYLADGGEVRNFSSHHLANDGEVMDSFLDYLKLILSISAHDSTVSQKVIFLAQLGLGYGDKHILC